MQFSIKPSNNDAGDARWVQRRQMRFAIKLFVGGTAGAMVGLWWIVDGVGDGPVNQLLGGMLWKGPLMFAAGAGAIIMGFRMLREFHVLPADRSQQDLHDSAQQNAGPFGQNSTRHLDLPQLVGLQCACCQKSVSSIGDGTFCPLCGNPVHHRCRHPDGMSIADARCTACGGDANSPVAKEVRKARELESPAGNKNEHGER